MKYKCLATLFWCAQASGVVTGAAPAVSGVPKFRVGVVPAEDRWIALSDGSRVYTGAEVSYLLGHKLFTSGRFLPVLMDAAASTGQKFANTRDNLSITERAKQIPKEWMDWVASKPLGMADPNSLGAPPDIIITPVVERLVYASGARSNRLVYGFTDKIENPYNVGRGGSPQNEFVPEPAQRALCLKPDFFNGTFDPAGWGPFRSNFGADADEGVVLNILGFGLGFKQKKYEVQNQVRFLVDWPLTGEHREFVFQMKATGSDIMVAASYKGFSLAVEVQRSETLLDALRKMLPQIVDNMIAESLTQTWQTALVSTSGQLVISGGGREGLVAGMILSSPLLNEYEVVQVFDETSIVIKRAGVTLPFVGEPLRVKEKSLVWEPHDSQITSRLLNSSAGSKYFTSEMQIASPPAARAQAQVNALQPCLDSQSNWITDTIEAVFYLYGLWRYENIFDQGIHHPELTQNPNVSALRVAIIDTGIDFNDPAITRAVKLDSNGAVQGFDVLAMDRRPSDDNGHGTAVAKLLLAQAKEPVTILPIKAVGAHSETHSSAIFEGFRQAVLWRAQFVIVPFVPSASYRGAYRAGAEYAAKAGLQVILAPDFIEPFNNNNISVPPSLARDEFVTRGLGGTKLRLDRGAVATVEEFWRLRR